MRPPKEILLAGDDEERVALLRFLLRTHGFSVITAGSAAAADEVLCIDLLLVVWPLVGAAALLKRAQSITPHINTLIVAHDEDCVPLDFLPDLSLCRGQCSSSRILEYTKMLTARKRGPKPQVISGQKAKA